MSSVRKVVLLTIIATAAVLAFYWMNGKSDNAGTLRILTWVGYDEPDYVAAVERAIGRKVASPDLFRRRADV